MISRRDIRRHLTSEVIHPGGRLPGYCETVEHPDGLVLVDTGLIDTHPLIDDEEGEEWHAFPLPAEVVERVAVVIHTHLHFDHHGGNRLFPGIPIHVQRRELEDARGGEYTIPEWLDFPGATYVEHDGEAEILPGVRIIPAPGHTDGHQVVVVETDEGPVVLGGDVGHSFDELERGETPGQRLVLELGAPTHLSHEDEVRIPRKR